MKKMMGVSADLVKNDVIKNINNGGVEDIGNGVAELTDGFGEG